MTGWKTRAGGLLGIFTGLGMILREIAEGSFNFDNIMQGVGVISASLAALGLGHKVDKNTEAVKKSQ